MYSTEELKAMKPRMSIEYRISDVLLNSGNFNEIPKKAWGAYISTLFPIVDANGDFKFQVIGYNLYIGNLMTLNEAIANQSEHEIKELESYKDRGITYVVQTKYGIKPLKYGDIAFETFEEMANAITRIKNRYESIDIKVQNSVSESKPKGLKLQRI